MIVQLTVTLKIEKCDDGDPAYYDYRASALEAIANALDHAEGCGFIHEHDEKLSVQVCGVKLKRDNQ